MSIHSPGSRPTVRGIRRTDREALGGRWPSPGRDWSTGWRGWALVVLIVALHLLSPVAGHPRSERTAAWWGVVTMLLAVGQGLPLAWRHRRPVMVAAVVLACYAVDVVLVGLVPPFGAWVLLWSIGSAVDDTRRSVRLAGLLALIIGLVVVVGEIAQPGAGASLLLLLVTLSVTLAALMVRAERGRIEAVRREAMVEERLRIARDLHDLVGHGLSVVAVQSSAGRMALESGDRETARAAMTAVEASSRTAMRELRQMLGVLVDVAGEEGSGDQTEAPAPGIADMAALVENVRRGGMAVTAAIADDLEGVSRVVQLSAYRVLQEALTNAIKHAPGARVAVRVFMEEETLVLGVTTAGGREEARGDENTGRGLPGLRARVAAVGGEFRAGPAADGWLVEARFPLFAKEDG